MTTRPGTAEGVTPRVPVRERVIGLLMPFPGIVAGLAYALGDPARTATPTFASARMAAEWAPNPMAVWGVLILTVNVVMAAAILWGTSSRVLFTSLVIGAAVWGWWGVILADAALRVENANLNAWATYLFVAAIHVLAASTVLHRRLGEKPPR